MIALLRFWREGLIVAVAIFAALQTANARHWAKRYASEHEARLQIAADYKAFADGVRERSEEIIRRAAERASRTEARQDQIRQELSHDYQARIAALRAALGRLPGDEGGADTSSGGDAVSGPSAASGWPAGAGGSAVVSSSDQLICGINTIKAEAWLDWYERVKKVER